MSSISRCLRTTDRGAVFRIDFVNKKHPGENAEVLCFLLVYLVMLIGLASR